MSRFRIMLAAVARVFIVTALCATAAAAQGAAPLVIGETFTVDSKVLGETRRVNVYLPPAYTGSRSRQSHPAILKVTGR